MENSVRYLGIFLCLCVLFLPAGLQAGQGYDLISTGEVSNRLLDQSGKRRALFIYASWCPYCRAALPKIMKASGAHPGAVLPLSVDKDPQSLVQYMERFEDPDFELVVWDNKGNLAQELYRFGIRLTGGIPFIALLDESGEVYKQGNLDADEVSQYLQAGGGGKRPDKDDI